MPQMMPMYWLVICLVVNVFIFFFSSSYYYNIFVYSLSFSKIGSDRSLESGYIMK